MRLLDTETGMFVEINNPAERIYAILSHTWSPHGEQSYQEVREIQRSFELRARSLAESVADEMLNANSSLASCTTPLRHRLRSWRSKLPPLLRRKSAASTLPHIEGLQEHPQACDRHLLCRNDISLKIREACAAARRHGYRLLWIDSCCIDKQSSAELSEAINSMFMWYSAASVCLAYLPDFRLQNQHEDKAEMLADEVFVDYHSPLARHDVHQCCSGRFIDPHDLQSCKWFYRGWTLQELIAPQEVLFLCRHWRVVGSKAALADILAEMTGIEAPVLTHQKSFRMVSVADRFHWTRSRKTTRVEDEAYSLLGLFDIHMPIIYGEGTSALVRLQTEIMQTIPDQTLFAWPNPFACLARSPWPMCVPILSTESRFHYATQDGLDNKDRAGLLTTNLRVFEACMDHPEEDQCPGLREISMEVLARRLGSPHTLFDPSYSITPFGVYMNVPLIPVTQIVKHTHRSGFEMNPREIHLAMLACEATHMPGSLIAIACRVQKSLATYPATRKSVLKCHETYWTFSKDGHSSWCHTAVILSPELLARLRKRDDLEVEWTPISIPLADHHQPTPPLRRELWAPPRDSPALQNRSALEDLGYTVSCVHTHWGDRLPAGHPPSELRIKHGCFAEVVLVTLAGRSGVHIQIRLTTLRSLTSERHLSGDFYRVHVDVGTNLKTEVPLCSRSDHTDTHHSRCVTILDLWDLDFPFYLTRTVATREVLVPLSNPNRSATLRIVFFLLPRGLGVWSSKFTLDLYDFSDTYPSFTTTTHA